MSKKNKKSRTPQILLGLACLLLAATSVVIFIITRPFTAVGFTDWEMHDGLFVTEDNPDGIITFTCTPSRHGDVCEYDDAVIPHRDDAGWNMQPINRGPGEAQGPNVMPINGTTIDYNLFGSSYICALSPRCIGGAVAHGKFTYFQSIVSIPFDVAATQFTIDTARIDDGSRVTIFNSNYPDGIVDEDSYIFLGMSGTADLSRFLVSGEENRIVITHVDDCCANSFLTGVHIVFNNEWPEPVVTEFVIWDYWFVLLVALLFLLFILWCCLPLICGSKAAVGKGMAAEGLSEPMLVAEAAAPPPVVSGQKKKKWATVDASNYIWATSGGGAAPLKTEWGKLGAVQSAPGAVAAVASNDDGSIRIPMSEKIFPSQAGCCARCYLAFCTFFLGCYLSCAAMRPTRRCCARN